MPIVYNHVYNYTTSNKNDWISVHIKNAYINLNIKIITLLFYYLLCFAQKMMDWNSTIISNGEKGINNCTNITKYFDC